jgi:O-antigen/teichoic acid export membrane protein
MVPAICPLIQNTGINIQRAKNKHKFRSIIYFFMAILNVILSVLLCQKYAGIGSAIGTAISFIVANGLIMNIYYDKKIGIDIPRFWKNILRVSVGLIIPMFVGVLIMLFVTINSIWIMLLLIIAYTIVYCLSMYFLAMNMDEKRYIKIVLNKVGFKKIKS